MPLLPQRIFLLMKKLTESSIKEGINFLIEKDKEFVPLLDEIEGKITSFNIPEGFIGLIKLITEQQLSVASARAIYSRLQDLVKPMTPAKFLSTDTNLIKETGLSRQKVKYCLGISKAISEKQIDFESFKEKENSEITEELIKLNGIGDWTAKCYLLGSLKRIDVFPSSDLVLQLAVKKMKSLREKPSELATRKISESWKPYRSVAALILWSSYEK